MPKAPCEDVLIYLLFLGAHFVDEALEHGMVDLVDVSSIGAFLKKGYGNMLTKLNLKKDRLKDIADALDSADIDNVSYLSK